MVLSSQMIPRLKQFLWRTARFLNIVFWLSLSTIVLGSSSLLPADQNSRVRVYTRAIEFDYVSWTFNALGIKVDQLALGTNHYLNDQSQHQEVIDYLKLVDEIQQKEAQVNDIYANPKIKNPQAASASLRDQLQPLYERRKLLGPLAESIFQNQVSTVVAELGLTSGGQPIPPVLYHSTPLPMALIVSPRNVIRQDEDISLVPDLPIDQQVLLENKVDQSLNVSSLVVPIGGVGVYPTMVMQTTDLNWLAEVVSHEWTHNFLTLRPLGVSYLNSPELRTINETTASISGKEIGATLIKQFYPEFAPQPPAPPSEGNAPPANQPPPPPPFDFNAEMRITRVQVDKLLSENLIDQAESYMDMRREFFWEHGYHIRKLNQAYFAFYGAYADVPGGAAGTDPVGAAVRQLRAESPSLAAFLYRISTVTSYQQLQAMVKK